MCEYFNHEVMTNKIFIKLGIYDEVFEEWKEFGETFHDCYQVSSLYCPPHQVKDLHSLTVPCTSMILHTLC